MSRHLRLDPLPEPIRPGVHNLDTPTPRPGPARYTTPPTLDEAWTALNGGERKRLANRHPDLIAAILTHLEREDR